MNTTITPVVTPQQQMALAFRGYTLPEGTVVKPGEVHVWALNLERPTEWVEAIGRDVNVAVQNLVREVARP